MMACPETRQAKEHTGTPSPVNTITTRGSGNCNRVERAFDPPVVRLLTARRKRLEVLDVAVVFADDGDEPVGRALHDGDVNAHAVVLGLVVRHAVHGSSPRVRPCPALLARAEKCPCDGMVVGAVNCEPVSAVMFLMCRENHERETSNGNRRSDSSSSHHVGTRLIRNGRIRLPVRQQRWTKRRRHQRAIAGVLCKSLCWTMSIRTL